MCLSSYLTLALAKATEGPEDLTNFLTQPVSPEDLAGIFENEQAPSVANAYKDYVPRVDHWRWGLPFLPPE